MVGRQGLLRIFLISIECEGNTVSGNGAYASCIKRAAMSAGEILVMCGRPCWEDGGGEDNGVLFVPLSKWGRLDRASAWEVGTLNPFTDCTRGEGPVLPASPLKLDQCLTP